MGIHPAITADPLTADELLDDYTKAAFPLEVEWTGNGKVRLLAAFGDKVVGASYDTFERDGEAVEFLNQSLTWDGQGVFGGGGYPTMDLPPPPAKRAEHAARIQAEIDVIEQRLADNPNAPIEWRSADERALANLRHKIGGAA